MRNEKQTKMMLAAADEITPEWYAVWVLDNNIPLPDFTRWAFIQISFFNERYPTEEVDNDTFIRNVGIRIREMANNLGHLRIHNNGTSLIEELTFTLGGGKTPYHGFSVILELIKSHHKGDQTWYGRGDELPHSMSLSVGTLFTTRGEWPILFDVIHGLADDYVISNAIPEYKYVLELFFENEEDMLEAYILVNQ